LEDLLVGPMPGNAAAAAEDDRGGFAGPSSRPTEARSAA
jgi:hypothetical protein